MSPLETSHPQYLHRYPEKPVVNLASTSSAPVIPLKGHVSDLKSSPSMCDVTIKTGSAPSLRSASSNSNSSPTELHFNPNSDNLTFFHDEESDNKDDDINNDYASSEPKSIDTSISDSTAHTSNTKKQAKKPNRMSHNKIEKKYRTNINTKFLELKNAVPTLRILDNASEINFDELEGLTPAARLNKANILSKATEYIKHLESKNTALTKEIKSIRSSSNYTFQPSTSLNHNVPIEVISDLPNQPRYSHIVNPRHYNNNRASTYSDSNISSVVSPTANEYQLNRHFYNKSTQNSASNSSSNSNIYTNNFSVTTANSNAVYSESAKVENRNNYGYSASMNQHYQGTPYIYQNNYDSQHFQQNPQHHGQMQYQQQVHYQTSQAQPQQTHTTSNQPIQQTFQQNTQQQSSMQNISHAYPYDSSSMSRKIMVGGIAALVGTNLSNNNFESANDMYTLSANPILFIFNKSIHYLQLITLFSCFYFFINPLITSFIASFKVEKQKDENLKTEPFYVTILLSVIHMLSPDLSSTLNIQPNSTFTHLTPLNGTASFNNFSSLSIYPASPFETFMAYINVLKFNDVPKADFCNKAPFSENESIECAFNKIILLNMLSRKNPFISKVTKLNDKIESLSKHLINLSEKDQKYKDRYQYSKILEFIRFDKSFFDSKIIFDQLFEILKSLNHTKSTRETAINLYGKDSTGKGYNSVYEYLYATPLNKLNLFELVSVLWFVENVRLRLIKFLGDMVIDENNEDKEEEFEELAIQINKIESLVPTPCMKLIKCCKIFKSLLKPTSEEYLNDALKLILLNIEQNLISMKKNIKNNKKFYIKDELLEIVNSHIPILPKVLEIIKFVQKNPITCDSEESGETMQLISDENRLSLICSIILHQYKIGNYKYGRSLIKYLKREGSQNFMPTNSVSLMALIATFNTLVVILNHEKKISKLTGTEQHQMFTLGETGNIEEDDFEEFDFESQNSDSNVDEERENETEHQVLEQLLFSMRLYVGGDNSSSSNVTTINLEESIDYDILSLHYGLQSEFSHKLLELAKELVGYSE